MNKEKRTKILILFFAAAITIIFLPLWATESFSHGYKIKAMSIGHIWAKPTDTDNISVYGPLLNNADETDRLIALQSPIAEKILFRITDVNPKKWPKYIILEPHKPFSLAPWHEHLWLSGLKAPLKEGEIFPLTLTFLHAGTITVDVVVENQGKH